jgi:hypothetical protein
MPSCPTQPCPIPRCALEWFLAVSGPVIGTTIWWSGDPRLGHYDVCLSLIHIPMNAMRWGIALWLVGVLQMAALYAAPTAPQRLAAGLACFAWVVLAFSLFHGGMVAFACPASLLLALGELYVCAMLRGARWTG